MKPLCQHRTVLRGVALTAILLLTSACIDESALPPIEATPAVIAPSDPGPTVSAGSGATEQTTKPYGAVSLFLGASDTRADQRGLTNSASVGAKCATTRGCQPGAPTRPADSNFADLATDLAAAAQNGGSGTVLLQGNVDNQNRRITGTTSIALAGNRAASTAADLKKQLISQGVPRRNILIGAETEDRNCSAPGIICIQTQPDPGVVAACRGRAHCVDRAGANRSTSASAVLNVPRAQSPGPVGVSGSPAATRPGDTAPNPGAGIFGPGPTPASPATPSSLVTVPATAGPDDSVAYCTVYPADCPDVTDAELSVRVTVAVPNVFRVGAQLREQDVAVESVVLYCGTAPCPSTGALRIDDFRATLSLPSSSSSYRLCATSRSVNCAYYLSTASTPTASATGSSIDGGRLRVGFLSPTPSTPVPGVKVRPTLDVSVLQVTEYVPVWVGGTGCNATTPARACWAWESVDTIDMRTSVSVRTTGGESFARSGSRHSIDRIVVGTVGS